MTRRTTSIAASDTTTITVRGHDLVQDLIGRHSFTEMLYFLVVHRFPNPGEARMLDACLVTLMEHGWTPSSIITRLTADSVPNQVQVAIAAGLLSVGDVFAGTMDGCARILADGVDQPDPATYCAEVVGRYRAAKTPMPGFGHPFHKPDDPRPPRLFQIAAEEGVSGRYIALLQRMGAELDQAMGRHLTINATGAIAACLLEIGIPTSIMRGIAVVSRAGGLAGHVVEELQTHAAREIWRMTEEGVPYKAPE